MGGATVEGLIKGERFRNEDITVADPSQQVVEKFAQQGVSVTTDNQLAAQGADIVCVCVKPWLVEQVLKGIKDVLDAKKQILIVIAAGVSSAKIKEWLPQAITATLCGAALAVSGLLLQTVFRNPLAGPSVLVSIVVPVWVLRW